MTDTAPRPAALRVEYRCDPLDALLADPRLLAVFGFGDAAAAIHADPRYLHVALQAHGDAPFECWFVAGDVQCGRDAGIAWSADGLLQFGALEIDEQGDIESAAAAAYARLQAWLARGDYPHPLRIWNYMDAITEGEGDDERYRRFCVGRARGIGRELAPGELPAATAIGHPRRSSRFQLYWLAAMPGNTPHTQLAGYDRWVAKANNASFAAQAAYDELVPAFEALFEREGRDCQSDRKRL